jgi:serine/threonine protein kinase/Tfp pilus assembly protein PilF
MDDKGIGLGTANAKGQFAATCYMCGQPLTQCGPNGECLRCLAGIWLLENGEQSETSDGRGRLAPGPLQYAHFEVEIGADGFPIELGAGAMAVTYHARDTVLNSVVALKVIGRSVAQNPDARSRFLREARAAANIHHPNVARVTYYGEQDGECFYAMELVEGETLEARVRRDGPMPLAPALQVIEQAARALVAAEACGVVHRDIKPSNIMVESDASDALRIKLIDYGIAKITASQAGPDAEQTQAGFIGTPAFASPEQFAGAGQSQIDTRSDIYSLGVTLWYLLTSRTPFVGRTMEEIRARQSSELPLQQLKRLHVPGQVIALLKTMLAPDPKDRPQTARELLFAVHSCYARFSPDARSRRSRTILVGAAAMFIIAAISLGTWWYQRTRPLTAEERSIAVLPFKNLSGDTENAYFADGIQDEILTRLSKIGDLKVISRTSTESYKSAPKNLRHIAKQLGVAHILEGSVQKSGDTVRVSVQLIRAANDSHLWADTFDRKLTDIFSVESEVARSIADQLRAKLTSQEEQVIAAKPTDNPEAYDAYLRGLAYTLRPATNSAANALAAQKYLKQAVRLDPKFARAWAVLSTVDARGYRLKDLQPTIALREEARQTAETALALEPNLGEAVLAKGYYYYFCLQDYDAAVHYFEQARLLLPSSSQVPESLAYVTRRRGQWEQSGQYFDEAERLDPRNVTVLLQHASSYMALRHFPEATRKLDQVLNMVPGDVDTLALKAAIAQAEGDLTRSSMLLSPLHPSADDTSTLETQIYQGILERQPAPMITRLQELLGKPDPALGFLNGELRFWLGWAQEVADEHSAAQETWRHARSELESFLKEQPENFHLLSFLALTNMGLGDKTAAFAFVDRAMAAVPIEKDAIDGTIPIEILARVAARMGEPDRSIPALQKLLSIPGNLLLGEDIPLTPALLRLDPMFDPLRNDPRFQKLASGAAKP